MEYLPLVFLILFFSFLILRYWYGKYARQSEKKFLEWDKNRRHESVRRDVAQYRKVYGTTSGSINRSCDCLETAAVVTALSGDNSSSDSSCDGDSDD